MTQTGFDARKKNCARKFVDWALFNLMDPWPRGNGLLDSALVRCAGSPGSIPAVGKSNVCCNILMVFSPSRYKVVGKKRSQTPDK